MADIKSRKIYISPITHSDEEVLYSHEEFDRTGNVLLNSTYMPDGELDEKTIQTFNEKGQILEQRIFDYSNEVVEKHSYNYSDDSVLLSEEISYADGSSSTRTFNRENANLIIETLVADDGLLEEKIERYLNEEKQVIKQLHFNEDEKLTHTEEFEYTGNLRTKHKETNHTEKSVIIIEYTYSPTNQLLQQTAKNEAGKVLNYMQFEYDEKGRLLKQKSSGMRNSIAYEYDDENHTVTETHFTAMGTIDHRMVTYLDENNRIAEQTTLQNKRRYEYEFFE